MFVTTITESEVEVEYTPYVLLLAAVTLPAAAAFFGTGMYCAVEAMSIYCDLRNVKVAVSPALYLPPEPEAFGKSLTPL